MTALIRTSSLVGYKALVAELGGGANSLLERFNIQPEVIEQEDNLIPIRSFIHLLEATAKVLDCPDFGLRLAAKQGFLLLGPIGLIGLNSPTVGDALNSILKYLDFHSPATLSTVDQETDPERPRITFDVALSGGPFGRQIYEIAMGNVYQELMIMTQGCFVPQAVLFRHSTTLPQSLYQHYFRTKKVFFEQDVNAVVIRPEDLTWRLDKANPQLQKLVAEYVRQASASHPTDTTAQVRFLIKRLLPSGSCGIRQVAKNLCMHERTLQRQLATQNLTFEKTLESVRSERAMELICNSTMSMAQIAAALGYSEQAAFNRACSRWFGTTPMRIRRSRQ